MHVPASLGSAPFGRRIRLAIFARTMGCLYFRVRGARLADSRDPWGAHEDDE